MPVRAGPLTSAGPVWNRSLVPEGLRPLDGRVRWAIMKCCTFVTLVWRLDMTRKGRSGKSRNERTFPDLRPLRVLTARRTLRLLPSAGSE